MKTCLINLFQQWTLPLVFANHNVYIDMPIGIGKTTLLLISMTEMIQRSIQQTQTLLLVATAEAAIVAHDKFLQFTQFTDITSTVVYFNCPKPNYNAQVVIGTPREVSKAIDSEKISLRSVNLVCCDDVDRTVNFKEIKQIISDLKEQSQFLMSGTTSSIHEINDMVHFEKFQCLRSEVLSEFIRHIFITETDWDAKISMISGLAASIPGQIIVFISVSYILCLCLKILF